MPDFVSVSFVARRLGVPPRRVSDLFYKRKLDDDRCPVVEGRRSIPADYVPEIRKVLKRMGDIKGKRKSRAREMALA